MTIADINIWARNLCDADTDNYTAANLLIAVNNAYETVVGWILNADGRWQFDDHNFSTFPEATTTLVAGQRDYQFDSAQLRCLGASVKDVNGNLYKLQAFDPEDTSLDRAELLETSGQPLYYDVDGSSVVLYPAPDNGVSVTLTAGLKLYFQRTADVFTSAQVTTGTKQPGFASPFHMVLSYMAAIPYCIKNHPDRVNNYEREVMKYRAEIIQFYTKRNKEDRPRITTARISHR